MGQTRIRYFDADQAWMSVILNHIDAYQGPSIAHKPRREAEELAAFGAESSVRAGQGFFSDAAVRRAVEERAVEVAVQAYEKLGYAVQVAGRPYDLLCVHRVNSDSKVWVEVKGTQGASTDVVLTRGEVEFYSSVYPNTELFVVHSIEVNDETARGGVAIR